MKQSSLPETIEEGLDYVEMHEPGEHQGIAPNLWAVSTARESIIAYFVHEADAARFRLNYINRLLNP